MEYDSSNGCYCLQARKAALSIKDYYDKILSPSGVTVRQYSLLLNISKLGVCSVRELSDATELDRSTLTRGLKPLFLAQYIVDAKGGHCRDSKLQLTGKGEKILAHAMELWELAQKNIE